MNHHPPYPDTHHDVSSNTIFGFWVYLMTDCVLFAALFATYAVLRDGTFGGPSGKELFDLPFALGESMVLLVSSFTCGIALLGGPKRKPNEILRWLGITFLFGLLFMVMEVKEFHRILSMGYSWQTSAFLSSYFTLVGTHGLHVLVGLMMMGAFSIQLIRKGVTGFLLRRLVCLKMYWHFLYLIWIFTFIIVYLMGAK